MSKTPQEIACLIVDHASRWDADARLLGNIRAADIVDAVQWLLDNQRPESASEIAARHGVTITEHDPIEGLMGGN